MHHVPAGPLAPVPKEALHGLVPEFTQAVLGRMAAGHRPDALHANYWLSGIAGHTIKHELDLPLVSTFHTLARVKAEVDLADDSDHRSAEPRPGSSAAPMPSSPPAKTRSPSWCGSTAPIRAVSRSWPPASTTPSSPPASAARPAGRSASRTGGRMLLFVGRIQPLKGLDVAVGALAELADRCPDAFLVVVGGPSGPAGQIEVDRMHLLVRDLGLQDRVRFVPPQPHELLSTFYRAADVCVVPSRSESFGLVALEAAACGTPVVAAAVGGLTSLVDHGRTGFLVEGRDPASFADAVAEVLCDPVVAAEVSRQAAIRAQGYTWSIAAARLRRLYADLTSRQLVECP